MSGPESPPPLPREVSGNGSEIWAWGAALSAWSQRQQRIRDLRGAIFQRQRECGACQRWMTRSCPKETNTNGRQQGPSMKAPICNQFEMNAHDAERISQMRRDLDAILSDHTA